MLLKCNTAIEKLQLQTACNNTNMFGHGWMKDAVGLCIHTATDYLVWLGERPKLSLINSVSWPDMLVQVIYNNTILSEYTIISVK